MRIFTILIATFLVGCTLALIDNEWKSFKSHYLKHYENITLENNHHNVYVKNIQLIKQHNEKYSRGEVSFALAINEFADLTNEEFIRQRTGLRLPSFDYKPKSTFQLPTGTEVPSSIDWRDRGYVTPVKDQGQCGSCWAFSATGATEGQHYASTGKLVSLSEQNLMDCSWNYRNTGCTGGWPYEAFRYIIDNNGVDTETSYPYDEKNGICRFKRENVEATISGYVTIRFGDEDELMKATGTVGPISVCIDASGAQFQLYSSGIYYSETCNVIGLNHAVLAVGYGTTNGEDYWLVKNSWGKGWGDNGYIKMARNRDNNCGIASRASYPVI